MREYQIYRHTRTVDVVVGTEVCDIVTTGMYSDPLAIYREYIQNAVDALVSSGRLSKGMIQVFIDPGQGSVTIRDNGPGMDYPTACRSLVPIGVSEKSRGVDRGFRGIGRLSALAFADRVSFVTRAEQDSTVTEVAWNGAALRDREGSAEAAEDVIRRCVEVRELDGGQYPRHFFEVQITGVQRFAAGSLLNRTAVRDYIGEVCPVPMRADFPFTKDVDDLLAEEGTPAAVRVFVGERSDPITRPLGAGIRFSKTRTDQFIEFERILVPALGSDGYAALGWVAHSSYQGAIPKRIGIRGLRVRAGNIQVGGERVFDPLFAEIRFNRWCVGEVHVVDPNLVPNARRDYFEPGPHTRNLENHLRAICRRIMRRCRDASRRRNKERKLLSAVLELEESFELAASGYLTREVADEILTKVVQGIRSVRDRMDAIGSRGEALETRIRVLETELEDLELTTNRLRCEGIPEVEAKAYRKLFGAMATVSRSPAAMWSTMQAIVAELTRRAE